VVSAPPDSITGAELSRLLGVSTAAVTQGTRRGLIVRGPDGRYDLDEPTNRGYVEKHRPDVARARRTPGGRKRARPADPAPPSDLGPQAPPPFTPTPPPRRSSGRRPTPRQDDTDDDGETYHDLNRRKLLEQTEKLAIANAKSRGELIPRDLVDVWVKRFCVIHTNEMRPIGDRLGAKLAGIARAAASDDLAAIAVNRALTDDVYRVLVHIQTNSDDFLCSLETEGDVPPLPPSADPIPETPPPEGPADVQ
jgi:hypothetical protein